MLLLPAVGVNEVAVLLLPAVGVNEVAVLLLTAVGVNAELVNGQVRLMIGIAG